MFAFIAEPLERADALRGDALALQRARDSGRSIRVDPTGRTPVSADGRLLPATPGEAAVFLGMAANGQAWFAEAIDALHAGTPSLDLRSAALQWPAFEVTVFAQARALLHWRATHLFCPLCAMRLQFSRGGWQGDCPNCPTVQYPRTDPAVIVAVSDGERLLLGRNASWTPATRYSTLAGFVEPGESLEQAVQREVFEESRVRVLRSRYLASQPWPFPGSLMLGFVAHAEPDQPRTEQDELEDARWFSHEEIGRALVGASSPGELQVSPPLSISRWLIKRWYDGERA